MASRTPPRPVIGINADFVAASKTLPPTNRLAVGYSDVIFHAGGLPLILPVMHKEWDVDAVLDKLDGVVLSGGLDLDPKRQNLPSHPTIVPMTARREDSDSRLLKRIMEPQDSASGHRRRHAAAQYDAGRHPLPAHPGRVP